MSLIKVSVTWLRQKKAAFKKFYVASLHNLPYCLSLWKPLFLIISIIKFEEVYFATFNVSENHCLNGKQFADPDQTPRYAASDLGLYRFLKPFCWHTKVIYLYYDHGKRWKKVAKHALVY